MQEVKSPKKPFCSITVWCCWCCLSFNHVTPLLLKEEVAEVDYSTFMSMTEDKNIGQVQVEDQQIVFTDKDRKSGLTRQTLWMTHSSPSVCMSRVQNFQKMSTHLHSNFFGSAIRRF